MQKFKVVSMIAVALASAAGFGAFVYRAHECHLCLDCFIGMAVTSALTTIFGTLAYGRIDDLLGEEEEVAQ